MSNHFKWDGLDELRQWLRELPKNLTADATGIVYGAANEAARRIVDRYGTVSGELKDGVSVKPMRAAPGGQFGVGVIVVSKSDLAHLFENGTQVRHTRLGANRGKIVAQHVVVQEVTEKRREMYRKLAAMMERNNLKVSGST